MKILSNVYIKIICVFMFVLLFSLSILSALGAVIIDGLGVYNSTSEQYIERIFRDKVNDELYNTALMYYYSKETPELRDSNLCIVILDENKTPVYGNKNSSKTTIYSSQLDLIVTYYKNGDFNTDYISGKIGELEKFESLDETQKVVCTVKGYIYLPEDTHDWYYYLFQFVRISFEHKYNIIILLAASLLVSGLFFIYLMFSSGIKSNSQKRLSFIDKIPLDLFTILCVGLNFLLFLLGYEILENFSLNIYPLYLSAIVLVALLFSSILLLFFMSISSRIKNRYFFISSLIYKFFALILSIIKMIPTVWKTALISIVLIFINLFFVLISIESREFITVFLYFVFLCIVFGFVIKLSYDFIKINETAEEISVGFLYRKVNIEKMFGILKSHGATVNVIGNGIEAAVEKEMKSERLKTELITNVSHDIKTPLTSIINYVDLLKKANSDDEKEKYIEVLERQSLRLKRLTEDLVEASKAATGNINTDMKELDICQLIKQAVGEYSDRLENAELEVIISTAASEMNILADGKLMWRITDNLLSNICKYSLPKTRVYIDIFTKQDNTIIIFKNISKEKLNIPADELMERFVRADSSRNSEGSGLGLNIAKSLAEIQNASLTLEIDGDLFRAKISIPSAK